jgi:hypothetical protein
MSFAFAMAGPIEPTPPQPPSKHFVFIHRPAIERYENAPLKGERRRYLESLKARGTSHARIKCVSSTLLNVVRLLGLVIPREITPDEVRRAGETWAKQSPRPASPGSVNHGQQIFVSTARQFLRFHRLLSEEGAPLPFFED